MNFETLQADATAFLLSHAKNTVSAEDAMREDLIGMQIFDAPIFGVASADDPLFAALQAEEAVHPEYRLPTDWVPEAKSILSFFAPFTSRIKKANAQVAGGPADEWQHGRAEGEEMISCLRRFVTEALVAAGYASIAPQLDAHFKMLAKYAPNWSERHTGYICGLGTFGLSKGLITEKGVAGRLGSVVTACPLPVTERPYQSLYAYCTMCGACAKKCPPQCIDAARGPHHAKAHPPCDAFLETIRSLPPRGESQKKRYGCGKCQTAVPCQDRIPKAL